MFRKGVHNLVFILILIVVSLNASAQQKIGTINLLIKNDSNKGIPFATVSLIRVSDSKILFSKQTDSTGHISYSNLPDVPFAFQSSSIGYSLWRSEVINNKALLKDTLVIKIHPTAQSLAAISITAKKPLIENKIDKTVINVDAFISNAGSTVLDALTNAPNVDVDNNGNISLKGKSQVVVYIDGKQNYLSGADLSNYLKTLPSSLADQIEIITQPSAKFDASGNAGIINIKLKRNTAKGLNTALSTNFAQGKYSRSANSVLVNYKNNNWNLFGNLSDVYAQPYTNRTIGRILNSQLNQTKINSSQNQDQAGISNVYSLSAGASYIASKKTDLGILVGRKSNNRTDEIIQNANFFDQTGLVNYSIGKNTVRNNWNNNSAAFNLHHKLNSVSEVSFDLNYEGYKFRPDQDFQNATYDKNRNLVSGSSPNPFYQKTDHPSNIDLLSFKADYASNFGKNKMEVGIKSSYINSKNVSNYYELIQDVYLHNNDLSNTYNYTENINAGYLSVHRDFNQVEAQIGLRGEQTISDGALVNTSKTFHKNYLKFFPSVYFGFKINKNNNLSFSYAKRIDRPAYLDLNPFSFIVDPYTINKGNAMLQPFFTNNFEANYNYKQRLNISANYSVTNRLIDDNIYQDDQTGILTQTKDNLFRLVNVGLTVNYTANFSNWGTLLISDYLYQNHFTGTVNSSYVDRSQTTNLISVTQQFMFKKHWSAELFATYNSASLNRPWFFRGPRYRSSITIGKGVLNNKGSIKLKLSDPFNIEHGFGSNDFNNIHTTIRFKEDSRILSLTFSYRFQKGQKTSFKNLYTPEEKSRLQ